MAGVVFLALYLPSEAGRLFVKSQSARLAAFHRQVVNRSAASACSQQIGIRSISYFSSICLFVPLQIIHQCKVLVVSHRFEAGGLLSVHAGGVEPGTSAASVLGEEAEVATQDGLCTLHVAGVASAETVVGETVGRDAAPVVRHGVAPHIAFAEPVAVPVADGDVVEVVAGLFADSTLFHCLGAPLLMRTEPNPHAYSGPIHAYCLLSGLTIQFIPVVSSLMPMLVIPPVSG